MDCAKILVEAGADVNQRTHYGWTPLLTATQNRHYKLAAYLLEHGANPNIANNGGWTPLYLATDNRNIEGGDYPVRTPDMDHLDYIKLLLDKARTSTRGSAACNRRPTDMHRATAPKRAPSSPCNGSTRTARRRSCAPPSPAMSTLMKLLLAHGADPKIPTAHNVTRWP